MSKCRLNIAIYSGKKLIERDKHLWLRLCRALSIPGNFLKTIQISNTPSTYFIEVKFQLILLEYDIVNKYTNKDIFGREIFSYYKENRKIKWIFPMEFLISFVNYRFYDALQQAAHTISL